MNIDSILNNLNIKIVLTSGIFFLLTLILLFFLKKLLVITFRKISVFTISKVDNIVAKQIDKISIVLLSYTALYFTALYLGIRESNSEISKLLDFLFYLFWGVQIVVLINKVIKLSINALIAKTVDKSSVSVYSFISIVIRFLIWILAVLFILANLGYDVNAFVAGLGIGGLAIALALQNVLKDLFSSFLLITDKPIRINDYVTIGDFSGVVKEIGIRSTRLTTDEGSEVIISNGDLVNRVIKNYKSRKTQKVSLSITIEFKDETIVDKLTKVIGNNESVQKETLNIFLTERTQTELKIKTSFNLSRIDVTELSDKLEELMRDIYTSVSKLGYTIKSITLDNPKI